MFKLGIFKKEQLKPENRSGFINKRKFIALDLYNCLDGLPQAEIDNIQEAMLRGFCLRNGVSKHTHSRRFDEFDRLSFAAIDAHFPAGPNLRVHDIAVSDGRTCSGLYNHLNDRYGEGLDFLASDPARYLYILKRAHSANRLIIDDRQQVLQIITPPFVFLVVRPESLKLYPLNHLLRHLVTALYARPLLKAHNARSPGIELAQMDLLCQECRTYIREQRNFRFESYDVLAGSNELFDIIRAMNILNPSYFSKEQLQRAVKNILQSLREGGLFVTGSNAGAGTVVNGAIYKKTQNGMARIEVSGNGSTVERLGQTIGLIKPEVPEN
jgi:SAM-dependent methyltransferase